MESVKKEFIGSIVFLPKLGWTKITEKHLSIIKKCGRIDLLNKPAVKKIKPVKSVKDVKVES